MRVVSFIVDIVLAAYIGWQVIEFVPQYRQLKQAVANGEAQARTRIYYRALAFEWISALLALVALRFDWGTLNPKWLALGENPLIQQLSTVNGPDRDKLAGVLVGVAVGTVGFILVRIMANRRRAGTAAATVASNPWWRKLLPDFSALLPVTAHERLLWAAVAVSAGICEETVFRGWLLVTLHGTAGLGGTVLIVVAASIFGLAHAYQGVTGVILTALAGAFFCVLYVVSGSLLLPILLHAVVDLRFALMPAPRTPKTQSVYA